MFCFCCCTALRPSGHHIRGTSFICRQRGALALFPTLEFCLQTKLSGRCGMLPLWLFFFYDKKQPSRAPGPLQGSRASWCSNEFHPCSNENLTLLFLCKRAHTVTFSLGKKDPLPDPCPQFPLGSPTLKSGFPPLPFAQ